MNWQKLVLQISGIAANTIILNLTTKAIFSLTLIINNKKLYKILILFADIVNQANNKNIIYHNFINKYNI